MAPRPFTPWLQWMPLAGHPKVSRRWLSFAGFNPIQVIPSFAHSRLLMAETSDRPLLWAEAALHLCRQLFDLLAPGRVVLAPVAQAVVAEELALTVRQSRQVRGIGARKLTASHSSIPLSLVRRGPMKELAAVFLLGVDLGLRYTSGLGADTMIHRSVDVYAIFGWVMRDWKSWLAQRVVAIGIGLRLELLVPAETLLQSSFVFSEPPLLTTAHIQVSF